MSAATEILSKADVYQSMGLFPEALEEYRKALRQGDGLDSESKKTIRENIVALKEKLGEHDQEEEEQIELPPKEISLLKENLFREENVTPVLDNASAVLEIKQRIRKLIKEAKLYHSQGLLEESKDKYTDALEVLRSTKLINDKENLINVVINKLEELEGDIDEESQEAAKFTASMAEQEHIRTLLPGAEELELSPFTKKTEPKEKKSKDAIALKKALTMVKDGQYQDALPMLNRLIERDAHRVVAAKNILRCHIYAASIGDAVSQYEKWMTDDLFLPEQLDSVQVILQGILEKKGIIKRPEPVHVPVHAAQPPEGGGWPQRDAARAAPQSSFDEAQFEMQDDGDYSEILDTIKPVERTAAEAHEFEDGEYVEFDFIDNVDKRDTPLPAYINEGEKADYEEFDIIDG
jgi:tetratricopeptide (TPR) repeat protein